jgi:hypothetical protein
MLCNSRAQLGRAAGYWFPGCAECVRGQAGLMLAVALEVLRQQPPLRESGHAVDITARIERSRVLGGLISEYRRAA